MGGGIKGDTRSIDYSAENLYADCVSEFHSEANIPAHKTLNPTLHQV